MRMRTRLSRGRRWLAVIIAVLLVLALFFGAMCLLPKLVERPRDDCRRAV